MDTLSPLTHEQRIRTMQDTAIDTAPAAVATFLDSVPRERLPELIDRIGRDLGSRLLTLVEEAGNDPEVNSVARGFHQVANRITSRQIHPKQ